MALWGTPFDRITAAEIQRMIESREEEGRHLDYKESLSVVGQSTDELLVDLISFANGSGGDIVFGVRESRDAKGLPTGAPDSIAGLGGVNLDAELLALSNAARDRTDPVVRFSYHKIELADRLGPVVVLRVPQSWTGPHMLKGRPRFYVRGVRGNEPMGIHEIRRAFLGSEGLVDGVRRFRDDRLARILAGELPVRMIAGPLVVVHSIPLAAITGSIRYELSEISAATRELHPYAGSFSGPRPTLEGVAFHGQAGEVETDYVAQIFRSGASEVVWGGFEASQLRPDRVIASQRYEADVVESARQLMQTSRRLGTEPPIFYFVTLLGFDGYTLANSRGLERSRQRPFQRSVLTLPECLVESETEDVAIAIRSTLDAAWNAVGITKSPYYDEDGNWRGGR